MKFQVEVPETVKRAAARGLELRAIWHRGGTKVGLRTARRLRDSRTLPGEFVRHIANYFPRHAKDNLKQADPPSNGYIAWLLWGGDPGRRWSSAAVRMMDNHLETV